MEYKYQYIYKYQYMNISVDTIRAHEYYIAKNNYTKICGINLYCCEYNLFGNSVYYLQQLVCCYIKDNI